MELLYHSIHKLSAVWSEPTLMVVHVAKGVDSRILRTSAYERLTYSWSAQRVSCTKTCLNGCYSSELGDSMTQIGSITLPLYPQGVCRLLRALEGSAAAPMASFWSLWQLWLTYD